MNKLNFIDVLCVFVCMLNVLNISLSRHSDFLNYVLHVVVVLRMLVSSYYISRHIYMYNNRYLVCFYVYLYIYI